MRAPLRRAIETTRRGGYGSEAVGSFPVSAARELRAPQRIRVLVADDEPQLRGALAELLAQEEHVFFVGAAADADEATALAERAQPSVALLAAPMPAGVAPRPARQSAARPPATRPAR